MHIWQWLCIYTFSKGDSLLSRRKVSEWDDFMLTTWSIQGVCFKISLFYPLWSTLFHLNCCYGLEKKYTHQRTPVLKAVCEPGGPTEKTWQHTLDKLIATWTLFCGGSPGRQATAACLWRAYRLGYFLSCSVHLGPRGEMWRFAMTFHLATGPLSDHAPKPLWPWPEPSFPFKLTFSGFCHCGGRLTKLSWVVFLIWSDTSYCFFISQYFIYLLVSLSLERLEIQCLMSAMGTLRVLSHFVTQESVKLRRKPE